MLNNKKILITSGEIGEIRSGKDVRKSGRGLYIYTACKACGKKRWKYYRDYKKSKTKLCRSCSKTTELHHLWKGGRFKSNYGYIRIKISKDSPFFQVADPRGYMFEHRFIMGEKIGRCLTKDEVVHHKNGVKDDNRIENLELSLRGKHTIEHSKGYKNGYEKGWIDLIKQQINCNPN